MEYGGWIGKEDTGTESDNEGEKGGWYYKTDCSD